MLANPRSLPLASSSPRYAQTVRPGEVACQGADERTNGSDASAGMVTCAKVCSSQQIKIAMGAPSVALAMVEFDGDMEFMLAS